MGRSARPKPRRLPSKLLQIRMALGLSQNEILLRLGLKGKLSRAAVSGYEAGTIEPPLPTLLNYAKLAGVSTDVLIDDEVELPDYLPAVPEVGGIMPSGRAKSGRKSAR
ncbi:MAG: helix-turn-helix domain-containing protein [Acidobacteriota bacterium]|nr:helix-turn-helix domain-containing protein [Acidobacteriota bacterium]